jgi:hypothetical protein
MDVTISAIPYSAAGTPNQARIYAAQSTTEPSLNPVNSAWRLRATVTQPDTSTTILPTNSPSATTPVPTNSFSATGTVPGFIQTTSGDSFWKGDDSAQFKNLMLISTGDVNTTWGNTPGLRIGAVNATGAANGTQMRIDNNEIGSYVIDNVNQTVSATSTLYLNKDGGDVNLTGGGQRTTISYLTVNNTSTFGNTITINSAGVSANGDIHTNIGGATYGGLFDDAYTGTTTVTAQVNVNGRFIRPSSSIRYKKNVVPMDFSLAKTVLDIEEVTYEYKDGDTYGYGRYPGVIAEQAHEVGAIPWVAYTAPDADGNPVPEAFRYDMVTVAHNMLLKDLYAKIESLETEVASLRTS